MEHNSAPPEPLAGVRVGLPLPKNPPSLSALQASIIVPSASGLQWRADSDGGPSSLGPSILVVQFLKFL